MSSLDDRVRTAGSGSAPITSGSLPAAAFEVRTWLNWSSATATSLTLMPVFAVKSSTIFWVAATRSGRSSSIQTVMFWPLALLAAGGAAARRRRQPSARRRGRVATPKAAARARSRGCAVIGPP